MLFSATQTTKVQDLARISLRPGPVHIDVDKEEATSTVATLSQGYVVCPSDRRFLLLFTFLKKNLKKKVIVFFSSCNSVKYHGELLNYIDVPVLDLHVSWFHPMNFIDLQGHLGQTKATKANEHVFRVRERRVRHSPLYRCCCSGTRYTTSRLDYSVRSTR
jgi:hypothetical protein